MIASSPTIENAMCAEFAELNDITQTSLMDDFTTASPRNRENGGTRHSWTASGTTMTDSTRASSPNGNARPSREVSNAVTNVNV